MKISNFKKLREAINDAPPPKFDMERWMMSARGEEICEIGDIVERGMVKEGFCGTSACIAGYAALIIASDEKLVAKYEDYDIDDAAQEWLGLDTSQATHLFCRFMTTMKKGHAIKVLDKIIRNKRFPIDKGWVEEIIYG